MKRREFVRAITALPLIGSLQGLAQRKDHDDDDKHGRSSVLSVFLHGPFAVILDTAKKAGRVTAYVPFDPRHEHQFAFQTLQKPVATESESPKTTYEFSAGDDFPGSRELPYIDHGFDDLTFHVPNWRRDPATYFVLIDLPLPDLITYIPPAEGVLFKSGTPGMMPIQHILQYKARDWRKIRLRTNQKIAESFLRPLSFEQLYKQFREHWQDQHYQRMKPHATQQKEIDAFLERCARLDMGGFFFGVGLPQTAPDEVRLTHAKRFFNEVLLPSLGQFPESGSKQLVTIGDYGPFCQPASTGASLDGMRGLGARLVPASLTEDCRLGGIIGTCC